MHLGNYLHTNGATLSPTSLAHLWYHAVRLTKESLEPATYHSRLTPASFLVEAAEDGEVRLSLSDPGRIMEIKDAPERLPPWQMAAPEQTELVEGRGTISANVYNLGVLGYRIFAGAMPYGRRSGIAGVESLIHYSQLTRGNCEL